MFSIRSLHLLFKAFGLTLFLFLHLFKPQNEFTEEIEIISVINDDEDTDDFGSEERQNDKLNNLYYISPKTKVIFLARRYRFVFVLDLSPSLASGVRNAKKWRSSLPFRQTSLRGLLSSHY